MGRWAALADVPQPFSRQQRASGGNELLSYGLVCPQPILPSDAKGSRVLSAQPPLTT